ncbi:MAG: hypothetical protein H7X92_00800 [Chitinophagales bacterium]|nr:hypothetical protein [Hyphomicrobiales bacterium]
MDFENKSVLPPQMAAVELMMGLLGELGSLAVEHAQRVAQRRKDARRPRRGSTLRPGDDTPLWSAVVTKVRPHLAKRGAKANLARVLEVPRQRVHDYFVTGTQMPDAERMIHVLLWLAARETTAADRIGFKSPKPLN